MDEKFKQLKILLQDVDREFYRLAPAVQAKFAIEQINMWQHKFNEAKNKVPIERFVNSTYGAKIIDQCAEA
jgi:hypothetical protein